MSVAVASDISPASCAKFMAFRRLAAMSGAESQSVGRASVEMGKKRGQRSFACDWHKICANGVDILALNLVQCST